MGFEVGAGNLHDGQQFHELYKKLDLSKTQTVAVDAVYKTPRVVREIFKSGKIPAVQYTRPKTKEGFFRKSEYVYDEYFDCYLCPYRQNCTLSKNMPKVVVRHVWAKYLEEAEHLRHVTHIRDTNYRGLSKVKVHVALIFSCLNLKKLAKRKLKNFIFFFFLRRPLRKPKPKARLRAFLDGLCLQAETCKLQGFFC